MADFSELLFDLSSSDRLTLIMTLQKERQKLSHIAKRQNMTITEASRHLQRLFDAKLVGKDSDGLYYTTPFGDLALIQLNGLLFTSDHVDYFIDHDVSQLPYEFVDRFGELQPAQLDYDSVRVLSNAEQIFREAEEYIWLQSYQVLVYSTSLIGEKIKEGIDFRFICPNDIQYPPGFKPIPEMIGRQRYLSTISCRVLVTDKEAQLCLPHSGGKIDIAAFTSKETKFIKWCRDLFIYGWDRAKYST
jgi:predicted transcriptional regulator